MDTFITGAHVAVLDAEHAAGIVVAPLTSDDLRLGGPEGLHGADWTYMVRRLADAGWTFLEDEWEDVAVIAHLPDGRNVHGLYPVHEADSDDLPTSTEDRHYSLTLARLTTACASDFDKNRRD